MSVNIFGFMEATGVILDTFLGTDIVQSMAFGPDAKGLTEVSVEKHVIFRYPDCVDGIAGKLVFTCGMLSVHHPGIYRFGKAEHLLTKKILLDNRDASGDCRLTDLLVALKQLWSVPDIEIRSTTCLDCDKHIVINIEGVNKDNRAIRVHLFL